MLSNGFGTQLLSGFYQVTDSLALVVLGHCDMRHDATVLKHNKTKNKWSPEKNKKFKYKINFLKKRFKTSIKIKGENHRRRKRGGVAAFKCPVSFVPCFFFEYKFRGGHFHVVSSRERSVVRIVVVVSLTHIIGLFHFLHS